MSAVVNLVRGEIIRPFGDCVARGITSGAFHQWEKSDHQCGGGSAVSGCGVHGNPDQHGR